jgi:hypothetical protein
MYSMKRMKQNCSRRLAAMPKPLNGNGRYMPGLDGLRALAVLAVIVYHLNVGLAGIARCRSVFRFVRLPYHGHPHYPMEKERAS